MSIITLTSDFGYKDHFVGALKGKILSQFLEAKIVDISHEIDYFNIFEASYVIGAAYHSFPKNTVHIICVNTERTEGVEHIIMQWEDQYFIAADNGILNALLHKKKAQKIAEINIHDRLTDASDMNVFATAASHIAKGGVVNVIAKEITTLRDINTFQVVVSESLEEIKGSVIYIDSFGNCVTNITRKIFSEIVKNRNFEIKFKNKSIKRISNRYSDFKYSTTKTLKDFEGEYLAVFNEAGYLEIAIYNGNPSTVGSATSLLGLKFRDVVSIKFK
ncbi:SAM-dependent chlorinase/fluorinase [uncultured Flavobacterium sp.]|uniref:SAM hydrolase/SAM-dependent halogenase family protein n=1 Tax=uncultured Flavobacterium sp. TaxID=165435 RepID=UPI0030CA4C92